MEIFITDQYVQYIAGYIIGDFGLAFLEAILEPAGEILPFLDGKYIINKVTDVHSNLYKRCF